jgi:flagellar motor switch protein FliM
MQKGDVLPLEVPPIIQAEVDGVPVMECRYGVSGGQYALKVERIVGNADKIIADCGDKNG